MHIRSLALSCLLLTLPAGAQDAVTPPAGASPKPQAPVVTITLTYAGGTLADFCAQIRAREPQANIVVATLAGDARLPAMELRKAGLDQALEGACAIAESNYQIRMKDFRGPGEPVYTITAHAPATVPGVATGKKEGTEVFSLGRITDDSERGIGLAHTTVLSAVEAAVGRDRALASLLYHKESGLMIVRGSAEQLSIVNDVLRNLTQDVDARRRLDNQKRGGSMPPTGEDKK